jgi:MFS family permease
LTADERQGGLDDLLRQGVAVQIKLSLTEGVFIVGFALLLGASNIIIGILTAIPALTQLIQIPAVSITGSSKSRKRIAFVTQLSNRLAIMPMIFIPFIPDSTVGLGILIVSIFLQTIFVSFGAPSWNSWLRDLVSQKYLGRFFSKRLALSGIIAMFTIVLGGFLVELWNVPILGGGRFGFSVIFLIALVAGLVSTYYTHKMPEPIIAKNSGSYSSLELLKIPFRNKNFNNLLKFSTIWIFSTSLVAPFFAIYILSKLGLDLIFAITFTAVTQLVSVLFFSFWGRFSDQLSSKSVLLVSVPIFLLGTFLWTFTNLVSQSVLLIVLLVLIHLLIGFAAAGVNLASTTIGLKLAPNGESISYLAASGTVNAIAGACGPLVGGVLAEFFADKELYFSMTWLDHSGVIVLQTYHIAGLDFVILISVIVGVYALHRLALVKEEGEVNQRVAIEAVLVEIRRNVKMLTTIDGFRETFQLPLSILERSARKRESSDN